MKSMLQTNLTFCFVSFVFTCPKWICIRSFIHLFNKQLFASQDVPEVLEGRVYIEAPAVHISDIGSSQFHFSDSQTCFIILKKQKKKKKNTNREMKRFNTN